MSVEDNIKKSKRAYGDIYNKKNISVQLDRDLIDQLKSKLSDQNISLKSFIENLIKESL